MTVYVQWKWEELTKTFLIIFHLVDDYAKPNLRLKQRKFIDHYEPHRHLEKSDMTWAPSHTEIGWIMQILSNANIINGLKEAAKRDLRYDLEITVTRGKGRFEIDEKQIDYMDNKLGKKHFLVWRDRGDTFFCMELCQEYIDYLREVLRRHIGHS